MTSFLTVAALVLLQSPASPPAVSPAPAIVMGRVLDRDTHAPIADAAVVVRAGATVVDRVRTDDDGVFVCLSVPPGSLTFGAVKAGYQGSGSAGRPTQVQAASGQRVANVTVELSRFGAIGGAARDSRGGPLVDAEVRLLRYDGRGRWSSVRTVRTDDRGVYRFAELGAARFQVFLPSALAREVGPRAFPVTLAPSAGTLTQGRDVVLRAGEARDDVDLTATAVDARDVAVTVTSPDGRPAVRVPVALVASVGYTAVDIPTAAGITDAQGRVTLAHVPAGSYVLRAIRSPSQGSRTAMTVNTGSESVEIGGATAAPAVSMLWAEVPFTVTGQSPTTSVVATALRLSDGVSVSGRVVFDGTAPVPAVPSSAIVQLTRADRAPTPFLPGAIASDHRWETHVLPGRYVVFAPPIGAWMPRSAVWKGHDILDEPFDIDATTSLADVVVTYTDRPGAVAGTVGARAGVSLRDRAVILFPADRTIDEGIFLPRRVKSVTPADNGQFLLSMVPDGEYFVAVTDDLTTSWRDDDRLRAARATAVRVRVREGETTRVDLQMPALDVPPARNLSAGQGVQPAATVAWIPGPFVPEAPDPQTAPRGRMLRGRVVEADGTSLKGVLVTATGRTVHTTFTDDDGRFEIAALSDEIVRVTFTKPAYLSSEYGAKAPGRPGTSVRLRDDADTVVQMTLLKGAVLTGKAIDARGQPMPNLPVQIMTVSRGATGQRRLQVVSVSPASAETDDRGVYRVYGLAPGDYLIGVTAGISGASAGGRVTTAADIARASGQAAPSAPPTLAAAPRLEVTMAPTFFPSTTNLDQAVAVSVSAGDERAGVDIRVLSAAVSSLSGRVQLSNGQPAANARLLLFPQGPYMPADTDVAGPGLVGSQGGAVTVTLPATGAFTIRTLPPGTYTLFAKTAGAAASEFALMPVTVTEGEASIAVTLRPSPSLVGRLVTTGPSPMALGGVRLRLKRIDDDLGVTISDVVTTDTGEWAAPSVIPGRYWLTWSGLPLGAEVVAVMQGTRETTSVPIEVGDAAPEPLELRIARGRTAIEGRLSLPTGGVATDYFVVVFAAEREHWLSGSPRVRAVRPATDGRFVFDDLPAGEYRLAAVRDLADGEWYNGRLLEELVPVSVPIALRVGETATQDLRIGG